MKSLPIALMASMLLAALPFAVADHAPCHVHAPQEGMAHPLRTGHYIMVSLEDTRKIGEWVDSNGIPGLQTSACLVGGIQVYSRDTPSMVLP